MSELARFDYNYDCDMMMGVSDGEYVLFADHEAEVAGLRALVTRQTEALRGLKDELYRRSDAANTGTNADEWHEENGRRLGYEGAAEAVDEVEEALLADPSATSALEWLAQLKREAVRAELLSIREHGNITDEYEAAIDARLAVLALEAGKGEVARSERCPTCDSPRPELHPSVQCEGEVEICKDPWHGGSEEGPC